MTISLPIADSRSNETTPVALPSDSRMPATVESVPLDEDRWNAWRAKGRLADRVFAEQMRSMFMTVAILACAAGLYWIGVE